MRIIAVSCGTQISVTLFFVSTRTNPAAHRIAKNAEHIATAAVWGAGGRDTVSRDAGKATKGRVFSADALGM